MTFLPRSASSAAADAFQRGERPPPPDPTAGTRSRAGSRTLADARLHVERDSKARRAAERLEGAERTAVQHIAAQPQARWFSDWNTDVRGAVDALVTAAADDGEMPVLVAYNIPDRDCGPHSAGGVGSPAEYRTWMRDVAAGVGDREAVVVLEPDALALVSCLTPLARGERFALIREAVETLKANSRTLVYVDAGHGEWVDADEMASRLALSGASGADGFALNVANFVSTEANLAYGERVAARLGGAHFVVDTSRNGGDVPMGEWCNPAGAGLGERPNTDTGHPLADAFLWIKRPGESDGTCNGGPPAGEWWTEYAVRLSSQGRSAELQP
jgi:endoglucanase